MCNEMWSGERLRYLNVSEAEVILSHLMILVHVTFGQRIVAVSQCFRIRSVFVHLVIFTCDISARRKIAVYQCFGSRRDPSSHVILIVAYACDTSMHCVHITNFALTSFSVMRTLFRTPRDSSVRHPRSDVSKYLTTLPASRIKN